MCLVKTSVQFDSELHTYSLDGRFLKGITSTLLKLLFPDTYKGVDESILKRAAEKGSLIHAQCEMADSLGIIADSPEVKGYIDIKERHGLVTLENEYIVSDNEMFASPIDVVFEGYHLADIKTTYTLNKEYVSWQLSIYAYLFEMQNPTLKAGNLYAIHLRPKRCKLVEVPRKTAEQVEELITQYCKGLEVKKRDVPSTIIDAQKAIIELEKQAKEIKEKQEKLKSGLLAEMEKADVKRWETDHITLTRVLPTDKDTFDSKKFKEDHRELYEAYTKTSKTKSSIRITIK